MAASSGVTLGYGTMVRVGRGSGPTWTEMLGFDDVQFPDQDRPDVDVTHLRSPGETEESIRGLKPVATLSLPLHYVPGSATDLLLTELEASGEDFILEITPSGGGAHTWAAYLNKYRMSSAPVKDKKMAEAVFKCKAKLSQSVAASPLNSVLPAISGTAKVGQVLTAWPGTWQPSGTFTFQWQALVSAAWTNIAGATLQTYTPIAGQVGQTLRCIVTCTNTAAAVSATSGATLAVVA